MPQRTIAVLAAILVLYGFCILTSFGASDANASADRVTDSDDYVAAGAMKLIGWIGKFHPPATHFPIALIIAAGLAEVLFARTGRIVFDNARQYCLWFGIIAAIGTGALGWCFGGFHLVDDTRLLTTHRWIGTSTVVCCLVLAFLAWRVYYRQQASLRPWYRFMLLLAVILVGVNGFLGGAMLYGLNEFAW